MLPVPLHTEGEDSGVVDFSLDKRGLVKVAANQRINSQTSKPDGHTADTYVLTPTSRLTPGLVAFVL